MRKTDLSGADGGFGLLALLRSAGHARYAVLLEVAGEHERHLFLEKVGHPLRLSAAVARLREHVRFLGHMGFGYTVTVVKSTRTVRL